MSYSNKIIDSVSAVLSIDKEKICSKSKRQEIAQAKRIICAIMSKSGFKNAEISRALNIDAKAVHNYVQGHDIWLEKESYRNMYESCHKASEEYSSINNDVQEQLRDLTLRIISVESKYEHLKSLLLN